MAKISDISAQLTQAYEVFFENFSPALKERFDGEVALWGDEEIYTANATFIACAFERHSARIAKAWERFEAAQNSDSVPEEVVERLDGGHTIQHGGTDSSKSDSGLRDSRAYVYPQGYDGTADEQYISSQDTEQPYVDTESTTYGRTETYIKSKADTETRRKTSPSEYLKVFEMLDARVRSAIDMLLFELINPYMGGKRHASCC